MKDVALPSGSIVKILPLNPSAWEPVIIANNRKALRLIGSFTPGQSATIIDQLIWYESIRYYYVVSEDQCGLIAEHSVVDYKVDFENQQAFANNSKIWDIIQ